MFVKSYTRRKKENAEQLKSLLETFVAGKDFSVDKVKSFFDTNKNLLTSIYGNDKPSDLLLFFAQMRSKDIFKNGSHKAFFKQINNLTIKDETYEANKVGYWINNKEVDLKKIEHSLDLNPDRMFNNYISDIDKNCNLNILANNEYKTRKFKLNKKEIYNENLTVSEGKTVEEMNKNDYESTDEYISPTLDIDKILKEKFGFKTINEMSKDELGKLNLSYNEEFIYFLSSCDLGN